MLRIISVVFLGLLTTITTVSAADVALVIGNRNYQRASRMHDAERALNAAADLRAAGFNVVSGRDLSVEQTRTALRGFMDRLEDADRAVILLNGHFVHSESDTWFVPSNAVSPSRVSINFEGLSLSVILDIVSSKPGGAAVFLGTFPRSITTSEGIEAGMGTFDVPQGVFVATGKPDDIAETVSNDFLASGVGFSDALANAPQSVKGYGFISNMGALNPVSGSNGSDENSFDEGYWQAVQDLGTEAALRSYLSAYPGGLHAREARDRLDELESRSPVEEARKVEASLGLSRNERRKIQENLSLLGYDTRGIDGIFGRGTRRAISKWQDDRNTEVTGYLKRRQINRISRMAQDRAEELAAEARRKQRELEDADRAYWRSSGAESGNERGLRRYLGRYPDGLFADVAELRLDAIERANLADVSSQERQTWAHAKDQNTIEGYNLYLSRYPDGRFAEDARSKLEKLQNQAARQDVVDAAKKEEGELRLNGFAKVLVEQQLIALGFDAGSPDGRFDKKTRRALRKFQRARGFPVTGYLTRQTIVRLIAEAG